MQSNISNISKQTIENLNKLAKEITPKEYEKEFCKVAKSVQLNISECEYFKNALSKISQAEINSSGKTKIESVYDLIDILLQRVEKKNIEKMSQLVTTSMKPSISLQLDEELETFSIKIGDSPSLIFEESIQIEMEKFLEKRFEVDKKVLAEKTADIAKLITLVGKYLNDAIDTSKKGTTNISSIKDKISSLQISSSSHEELNELQNTLVSAAHSIENEINEVNNNFATSHNEVIKLEQKISQLEAELKAEKAKSNKDHLTQVYNRRAFEDELEKFEERYDRLNQDYAIVFFDLDFFKKVNDTYGHDGGDIVLKTFASLLQKLTRDIDIIARLGGEEFVAIINYNKKDELHTYVSRIKNVVKTNKFVYNEHKIPVTFSAGVELRSNCKDSEEVVKKSDELLYEAKSTGRNKIVFWDKTSL